MGKLLKEDEARSSNNELGEQQQQQQSITNTTVTTMTATTTSTTTVNNQPASSDVSALMAKITADKSLLSNSGTKSSFLQNVHTIMMSMYNTYYSQYLQQYAQQQQQLQALASAKTPESGGGDNKDTTKNPNQDANNYDLLKQQATFYAQQQQQIQTQLEQQLSQAAQQLVQEISSLAAAKSAQLSHQYQQAAPIMGSHHLMPMNYAPLSYPMAAPMGLAQPQPQQQQQPTPMIPSSYMRRQ